jgi:hypothetical protein
MQETEAHEEREQTQVNRHTRVLALYMVVIETRDPASPKPQVSRGHD